MITTKSNPAAFPSSLRQLKTSLVKNRGDVEKKKVYVRQAHDDAEDLVMLTTRHRLFRTGRRDLRKVRRQADVGQDDAVAVCRCVFASRIIGSLEGPPFRIDTSPRFFSLCCRCCRRRR